MRLLRTLLVGSLVLVTVLPSTALAQNRHAVDPADLNAAISQHVAEEDARRATIREALGRPEVRAVADKVGIDLDRITGSVATMNGDGLARAADAAQQVNQTLVGGQRTIVISTTLIIIVLLIVILIVVAA